MSDHAAVQSIETNGPRHELVVIDRSVKNYDELARDVINHSSASRKFDVLYLDSRDDGVAKVAEALSTGAHYDAVHLISHSDHGALKLGATWLRSDTLAGHAGDMAHWQKGLTPNADILIYGCNLAASQDGQSLLEAMGALTGADVAASVNDTGHESLGADWVLERSFGHIETEVAFSRQVQAHWHATLSVATFQQGVSSYASTLDTYLREGAPTSSFGSSSTVTVDLDDGLGEVHGLILFQNLFGNGAGQIPYGSIINSATLTVDVTNASAAGASISLHRMLANWSESSTWDSRTNGIQLDDTEAVIAADSTLADPTALGSVTFSGLETTVQLWSNGATNRGWAILNDNTNSWVFRSSETTTAGLRPMLTIDYTPGSSSNPILTVDTTSDVADGDTSSITALLADRGADGSVSLREAILAANNTANSGGPDQIHFAIGSGTKTINVLSALPTITGSVTIDGTTQPGFSSSPIIELNGAGASGAHGLLVTGSHVTIRGLVINRFDGSGIYLDQADSAVIAGNYIGTNVAGDTDLGNGVDGVDTHNATNVTIGGTTAADRNVIAGNSDDGIDLDGVSGATIHGNYIGVAADGVTALGNSDDGVLLENNVTGVDIGGISAGEGNIIAHNGGNGVTVMGLSTDISIRGNEIFSNGGIGIDLNDDGVTANDAGDGDSGSNHLQNFPVISSSTTSGVVVRLAGALHSAASGDYHLDFYASTSADGSGYGEGKRYLGSTDVTTDGTGDASFSVIFSTAVAAGEVVTATATDALGNTSEFALAVATTFSNATPVASPGGPYTMNGGASLSLSGAGSSDADGDSLTYQWDLNNDGTYGDVTGVSPTVSWATLQSFGINQGGAYTIGLRVSDGVATHASTTTLTVNNTAPTVTLSASAQAYTENAAATVVDSSATVADPDSPNFNGGALTVDFSTGGTTDDRLSVQNQGAGAGQVGVSGSNITYGGVTVGTFTGGSDGSTPLVISFNASADLAAVQAVARNVTFHNVSDGPDTTMRSVRFSLTDGDGGTSNSPTRNINLTAVNDAPSLTNGSLAAVVQNTSNPAGQAISDIFSGAFSDPDPGSSLGGIAAIGNSANAATEGHWQYSSDGVTWNDIGVVADNATALALGASTRLRFVPVAGYTGAPTALVVRGLDDTYAGGFSTTAGSEMRVNVNTSSNGGVTAIAASSSQAQTAVNPALLDAAFLISTAGDVSSSGSPGLASWTDGDVLKFGDPNLSLEPGTTSGTFSSLLNLDNLAADGNADVDAIHYVTRTVTVGSGAATLTLHVGDLLLSTQAGETFNSLNSLTVTDDEVFVFRPAVAGDYSSGTFIMLLDNFGAIHGGGGTLAISLVEQQTVVGDVTLAEGTFLFSRTGGAEDNDIRLFTPTGVGAGATAGSVSVLIEGDDLNINPKIFDVELVEVNTTIAGHVLSSGTLLIVIDTDDSTVGTNSIAAKKHDIISLTVSQTTLGSGSAVANASVLFEGADVGLGGAAEAIDAFTLVLSNSPPAVSLAGGSLAYTENDGHVTIDGSATVTDTDSLNFNGGALTVDFTAGGTASDHLGIHHQGTGAGQLGVSGSNLTYGGVAIGTFTGGDDGSTPLVVSFNSNATVSAVQAVTRNVTFANDSDDPATAARTVRFLLSDGDGATSSASTRQVALTAVNDAPSISLPLGPATNEDTSLIFSSAGGNPITISDVDAEGGAVDLTLSVAPGAGSLTLGATAGLTFSAGDGVADQTMHFSGTLAAVNSALNGLTFAPTANLSGGVNLSIDVSDLGNTGAGGAQTHSDSLSITVNPVNDGPSIIANSLTISEGGSVILSSGDLNASDVDNAPGQLSYSVSGASGGHFELVTAPGAAITSFTQSQINAGDIRFVHDGGEAAPSYSLQVSDGALTDGPHAAGVTFTNVNDAPFITANGLTLNEGTAAVLISADLNSTDPDNAPGQLTYSVSGVTGGQFELVSAPGGAITSFTQAEINSGTVRFVHDGGEAAPTYNVQVSDGSLNDGPHAAAIAFTNVNDGPAITANALTLSEGAAVALTNADLNSTDPDNAPAQLTYTVSGVMAGQFELVSAPGAAITSFTQAQINAGSIRFVHDGGEAAPSYNLQVSDGALSDGPQAAAIVFSNVNDAPLITANSLTLSEGGAVTLTSADLNATDSDNAPAQLTYTASGVTAGHFELVSAPGAAITNFTQAQINAGDVRFVHDGGEAAPTYNVQVSDAALSDGPHAAAISFTNVNDGPIITANGLTLSEGATVVLTSAELNATDPDHAPAQLTYNVSGVTGGKFELVSAPGVAVASFTQAQINAGDIQFVHDGGETAPSYTVQVSDGALSDGPQAAAIVFSNVNDAPLITANSLTLSEGAAVVLTGADLNSSDPDNAPGQLTYTVSGVSAGHFELVSAPGAAITNFTQAQINAGDVRFIHDSGEAAPTYNVQVSDAALSDGPHAAAISFTNVNDGPTLTANGLTLSEGATVALTSAELNANDPDHTPAQLTYNVSGVTGGQFELVSAPGVAVASFTQAQINAGDIQFVHDGGEAAPSYTVQVSDGALSGGPQAAAIVCGIL